MATELPAEIDGIRQQGRALAVDYPQPHRACLAVALPAMAVTLGARKPAMLARVDRFMEEMRQTCARLERTQRPPGASLDSGSRFP